MPEDKRAKKYVLIVEDQEIADDLVTCFQACPDYDFEVGVAKTLMEVPPVLKRFPELHVAVIDLWLPMTPGGQVKCQPLMYLELLFDTGALIFAYTGHYQMDTCIEAMKYGACDCIDKAECMPIDFVDRVVRNLKDKEERNIQYKRFHRELLPGHSEWMEQFGGKFVAIMHDEVVGVGGTRLEALLNYLSKNLEQEGRPRIFPISTGGKPEE
jgi:DNA-binding NtrC family response regulator